MLMFVGSDERWEQQTKDEMSAKYAEIGRWWEDLTTRGVIKGGEELMPRRSATTVRRVDGAMKVTDGPFIEAKEHVGGYALVDVPDLDAAIALAKSWPGGDVEIRPIVEH
jgi:hypothetical protein